MRTIRNNVSKICWCLGSLLALCLALAPTAKAGDIGEAEVRAAVETWVRYVTADARPDAVVERMEPYQVDGETVAYIAHLEGGGFCLCGADDLVLPVYFYSPRGTYDPENPNYQYILWEIGARLEHLQKGLEKRDLRVLQQQDALTERATFWQDLIARRIPKRVESPEALLTEPISMTLNLTSQWHQGSANPVSGRFNTFNARCPVLTPDITPTADEHALVGCTATAMAQVMYYWRWPNTGEGNRSVNYPYWWRSNWVETSLANDPGIAAGWPWTDRLQWTAANGGRLQMNGHWDASLYSRAQDINDSATYQAALATLWGTLTPVTQQYSVNFGAATYDWSIMQDTQAAPGSAFNAEMAELSYHAGVAAGMNYGILGSGAWPGTAFQDHFRYDPDATFGARNIGQMTEEIQWLRPLLLVGWNADNEGHTWVVFGYDKTNNQFRMNMGWGGGSDGWYSYDNVPGGFNLNQSHTTRIAPEYVVRFVGAADSGDGSPNDPYKNIEEAIIKASNGAALIFKAGSNNTFSAATLIIDRPLTLKGQDVVIRKK